MGFTFVIRSSGPILYSFLPHEIKFITFACVIVAPFGKPVDPEVNMMYAGEDPVILFTSKSSPLSFEKDRSSSDASIVSTSKLSMLFLKKLKMNFGLHFEIIFLSRSSGLE